MNKHWDDHAMHAELPAPIGQNADAERPTSDATTAGQLQFRELINLLRRQSPLILSIALCGTMLVFVVGLLIPPKYTAKAQIAIDPPSSGAQAAGPPKDDGIIETHVGILLSRDNLERAVNNLLDDPELQKAAPTVRRIVTERVTDHAPLRITAARWFPSPSELAHRLKIWIGRSGN